MDFNPVGWFEIPVLDLDRATAFYEKLLGISLSRHDLPGYEMNWFPADEKAKGITGALMKGMGYVPNAGGHVIYFTCPDIEGTLKRGTELGSTVILPVKSIGEYGHIAWLTDSEGNVVGLHSAAKP